MKRYVKYFMQVGDICYYMHVCVCSTYGKLNIRIHWSPYQYYYYYYYY